jgi:Tfp pilus assembly protein PilF
MSKGDTRHLKRRGNMRSPKRVVGWVGVVLAISVIAFFLWGCKGKDNKEQAQKHLEVGVQHFKEKELEEALKELKKAVELDPGYADAHYHLGGLYHALKAYGAAISEYKEVRRLDPAYPRIHTSFANLYYERGLMAWGRAVKFDRISFWLPDTTRKLPYEDKDGLLKLIEEYSDKVRSDTSDAETFSKLSQAYFVLAAEEYEKAVQANASDTTAQLYLGLTYSEQGYSQKAMAQYKILKKLFPNGADLLIGVLNQKEKEKERLEEIKKRGR